MADIKPVVSEKDFDALKEQYLSQVVRKRKNQDYNIGVLSKCRWIHDERCDYGKSNGIVAYTNMSDIYYGNGYSEIQTKLSAFHEFDHIRKGNQHKNFSSSGVVANSLRESGRVVIKRADRTIFFEEAFAHANACSFFEDANKTGDAEHDARLKEAVKKYRESSPYKYNVDMTAKIADVLGIKLAKFEELMIKRNKKGDDKLDNMFFELTGDKNFFKKLETKLNYFGTYVYQEAQGKKVDLNSRQKANQCKKEVDALLVYAERVKDGFEKKMSWFDRLFKRTKKQKMRIIACIGQDPKYSESVEKVLDEDMGIEHSSESKVNESREVPEKVDNEPSEASETSEKAEEVPSETSETSEKDDEKEMEV